MKGIPLRYLTGHTAPIASFLLLDYSPKQAEAEATRASRCLPAASGSKEEARGRRMGGGWEGVGRVEGGWREGGQPAERAEVAKAAVDEVIGEAVVAPLVAIACARRCRHGPGGG